MVKTWTNLKVGNSTKDEPEQKQKRKPLWVQPIHPIPSSMIKLTGEDKMQLEDVLFAMRLECVGLI